MTKIKKLKENLLPEITRTIDELLCAKEQAGRSPHTIKNLEWVLVSFFIESGKKLEDITPEDILCWIDKRYSKKQTSTRNQRLSMLSSFFKYCVAKEYIGKLPLKKTWRRTLPPPTPKCLDEIAVSKLRVTSENMPLRDRLIITLLESTGIRRAELQGLNLNKIDLEQRIAVIIGKGNRKREIDFTEKATFLLDQYIAQRKSKEEALLVNNKGTRLSDRSIYNIVARAGKTAALGETLHPHKIRHTYASVLLANGADLPFVAEALGHRSVNTAKRYGRIPTKEMLMVYDRAMGL